MKRLHNTTLELSKKVSKLEQLRRTNQTLDFLRYSKQSAIVETKINFASKHIECSDPRLFDFV